MCLITQYISYHSFFVNVGVYSKVLSQFYDEAHAILKALFACFGKLHPIDEVLGSKSI